jgi:hypothetical protein
MVVRPLRSKKKSVQFVRSGLCPPVINTDWGPKSNSDWPAISRKDFCSDRAPLISEASFKLGVKIVARGNRRFFKAERVALSLKMCPLEL